MMEETDSVYTNLPLATVIKLKGYPGLLMISKIFKDAKYDYRCIAFPEGFYSVNLYKDICFQEIESVYFLGYDRMVN